VASHRRERGERRRAERHGQRSEPAGGETEAHADEERRVARGAGQVIEVTSEARRTPGEARELTVEVIHEAREHEQTRPPVRLDRVPARERRGARERERARRRRDLVRRHRGARERPHRHAREALIQRGHEPMGERERGRAPRIAVMAPTRHA